MKFDKSVLVAAAVAVVAQAQIEESEAFMKNAFTYFVNKDTVHSISTEIGLPAMHDELADGK